MTTNLGRQRVVILGAAGRDFHNFNQVYRDQAQYEVVAFTATQIAGIADSEETPENQKKLVNVMSKMNSLLLDVITNTIEFIKTPDAVVSDRKFILDFLTNCDKKTADTIKKESIAIRESNEIKPFRMKCIKCSHEYEQRVILNNSDFFEVGS